MWRLADRQIDEFIDRGDVRVHQRVRQAVRHARRSPTCSACPKRDHETVPRAARRRIGARTGTVGSTGDEALAHNPLEFLYEQFTAYVEDRRREPARRRADRPGDRDVPRRLDRPRSSTSCASPPTSSPPARRRPCACSATALQLHRRATRSSSSSCATTASASRTSSRSALRIESPVKGDFRLARVTTERRRRRRSRRAPR